MKNEPPEARLEHACLRGRGHLVVTGGNRAEIDLLLRRVLDRAKPMATVRTDPSSAEESVDKVLADLLGHTDAEAEQGFVQRRAKLLELLAKAQEAERSIFFVVDTTEEVALDKLDKLCRSLDVAPEAAKRLRVVLVGGTGLRDELEHHQGRQLSARIGAYVRIGEPMPVDPAPAPTTIGLNADHVKPRGGGGWTLATACAVMFSLAVYAAAFMFGGENSDSAIDGDVRKAIAEAMQVEMPGSDGASMTTALRGDEPFLRTPLAIATKTTPTPRFAVPAKPAMRAGAEKAAARQTMAPAQRRTTTAAAKTPPPVPVAVPKAQPQATAKRASGTTAKPPVPANAGNTSIDSFMEKFR